MKHTTRIRNSMVSMTRLWRLPDVDWAILGLVLLFAIWSLYCDVITLAHASFDDLMQWLPLEVLVTLAVLAIWFWHGQVGPIRSGNDNTGRRIERALEGTFLRRPIVVLLLGAVWVGLLFVGMPYAIFWWGH